MESFAKRLKEAIESRGLTQTELAKRTGLDKSLISNYLSGRYKAKSQNLYLIANALNVSEAWLMGYDVKQTNELPATVDDSGHISEFVKLFQQLTDEQQALVISQIKGILSNQ